jgi:hypothetical protein
MFKLKSSAFLVALFALSACTTPPDWTRARASEVRLRDGVPGAEVAVLSDAKIEVVLRAFRAASRVNVTDQERRRLWAARCFDVVGDQAVSGRWLYEPESGTFSKMDPKIQPGFLLTADDRSRINALFPKKG